MLGAVGFAALVALATPRLGGGSGRQGWGAPAGSPVRHHAIEFVGIRLEAVGSSHCRFAFSVALIVWSGVREGENGWVRCSGNGDG